MVVGSINNYQTSKNSVSFGAKTRSEREAARREAEERSYMAPVTAEEIRILQRERERRNARVVQRTKDAQKAEEKQYNEDVRDIKETQKMINDLTQSGKDKNIFASETLKNIGKVADVIITGTLSGMALHWSTGKAFMMINKVLKKPKVANVINNIKKPFQIIGSSLAEGAQTAWNSMARKVKATKNGKKILDSTPIRKLNEGLDKISTSYNNFKTDAKNLKAEDIKSGVATVFGVSGFIAGAVEKLDKHPITQKKDN